MAPVCKPYFEDMTLSLEEIVNFGPKDDQMTPNIFNVLTENKATSIFCNAVEVSPLTSTLYHAQLDGITGIKPKIPFRAVRTGQGPRPHSNFKYNSSAFSN